MRRAMAGGAPARTYMNALVFKRNILRSEKFKAVVNQSGKGQHSTAQRKKTDRRTDTRKTETETETETETDRQRQTDRHTHRIKFKALFQRHARWTLEVELREGLTLTISRLLHIYLCKEWETNASTNRWLLSLKFGFGLAKFT